MDAQTFSVVTKRLSIHGNETVSLFPPFPYTNQNMFLGIFFNELSIKG